MRSRTTYDLATVFIGCATGALAVLHSLWALLIVPAAIVEVGVTVAIVVTVLEQLRERPDDAT